MTAFNKQKEKILMQGPGVKINKKGNGFQYLPVTHYELAEDKQHFLFMQNKHSEESLCK